MNYKLRLMIAINRAEQEGFVHFAGALVDMLRAELSTLTPLVLNPIEVDRALRASMQEIIVRGEIRRDHCASLS